MRMMTLAAAALMCSASAFAQTGPAQPDAPAASPDTTQPSDASTMSQTPTSDASSASTAPTSSEATSASATMPGSGSVDIAAYDGNKDGALSPLEFGMAMKGADTSLSAEAKRERFSRASGNGAIKLLNETAADFSKADKNQDRRVDSSELAMLHSGGVSADTGAATPITSGAGTTSPAAPMTSDAGTTTGPATPMTSGAGTATSAPPETGATMNTSPSGSPDTGVTSDNPAATNTDETDPSNPNTTATVPPTEPKN